MVISKIKVWSINDGQTGADMKLVNSINANIEINDVSFGDGNLVLITTKDNKLYQILIR